MPYASDDMMTMWELKIGGTSYWFACRRQHPLQALQWVLSQPEIDGTVDGLDDEAWTIRPMAAAETLSATGPAGESVGVLPLDADGCWEGVVAAALDLCKEDGDVFISEAWAE